MSAGYMIDADSMARLARLLVAFESGQLGSAGVGGGEQEVGATAPIVHPVRVGSTTADGNGTYPGYLLRYYPSTGTYYDSGAIRLKPVTPSAPAVQRYLGRLAGFSSGGVPVYLIETDAAESSTLTLDVVTSVSCVSGIITPVWTTVCIPGAYLCTTTTTTAAP